MGTPQLEIARAARPRVIVCDDYRDVLDQLRIQFRGAGFDADFCEDGAELVRRVLAADYDLIVTDLAMSPVDGWTAIERLRDFGCTSPVWAVSAYAGHDLMNRAQAGRFGVTLLQKPDGVTNLRERIEDFFKL